MRAPLALRRCLLAASTLVLFASPLTLLVPNEAAGAESAFSPWYRYDFYSDASYTTMVGQTHVNAGCNPGQTSSWGTQTAYYTRTLIHYCY
jgi:hypothetical protein